MDDTPPIELIDFGLTQFLRHVITGECVNVFDTASDTSSGPYRLVHEDGCSFLIGLSGEDEDFP